MKKNKLLKKRNELLKKCKLCNNMGYIIKNGIKYDCKCLQEYYFYIKMFFAGIDPEYWDITIEQWKGDQKVVDDITIYIQNLENALEYGLSLGFGGSHGVGKTLAANLILKAALKENYICKFITLNELLNKIKDTFNKEGIEKEKLKEKINDIKEAHFLTLDELGGEYVPSDFGKFTASECDLIFKYRRRNCLPTIITTNLKKKEFLDYYGSSLNSIISSRFKFIWISGEDFRIKQGKEWERLLKKNE